MDSRKRKIGPLDFTKAVDSVLKEYGDEAYDVMEVCIEEVADEATDKLRAVNHFKNDGTGAYAGSWINDEISKTVLSVKRAVHNEEHYRLTHLLEKGHVIKNGTGREYGKTDAYPHIGPVNDWVQTELVRKVKQKLEQMP